MMCLNRKKCVFPIPPLTPSVHRVYSRAFFLSVVCLMHWWRVSRGVVSPVPSVTPVVAAVFSNKWLFQSDLFSGGKNRHCSLDFDPPPSTRPSTLSLSFLSSHALLPSLSHCLFIYIYIYINVYIYVCVYMYICMYVCICIYVCVCIYIYIYI